MKKILYHILLIVLILSLRPAMGWPDVIHTSDGRSYEGTIVDQNDDFVTVETLGGRFQLPRKVVIRIDQKPFNPATSTPTPTPRPTNTRFPTSTSTATPTMTRLPTPVPTATTGPAPSRPAPYSIEQADQLITKYEKALIPKAKYVLAYYSKAVHAMQKEPPQKMAAIKYWSQALEVNQRVLWGRNAEGKGDDGNPEMEERFEQALEVLRTEAIRDPAAAVVLKPVRRRALRDIDLAFAWIDRQYDILIAMARVYEDLDKNNLATENYLLAYRVLIDQRQRYIGLIGDKTLQGDPFNLRRRFTVNRTDVGGVLIDVRLADIERVLEKEHGLLPDDYLYDNE